jgi:hypothetical protein
MFIPSEPPFPMPPVTQVDDPTILNERAAGDSSVQLMSVLLVEEHCTGLAGASLMIPPRSVATPFSPLLGVDELELVSPVTPEKLLKVYEKLTVLVWAWMPPEKLSITETVTEFSVSPDGTVGALHTKVTPVKVDWAPPVPPMVPLPTKVAGFPLPAADWLQVIDVAYIVEMQNRATTNKPKSFFVMW